MGRFLIFLSYIGTKYSGFQRAGLPSYLKYGRAFSPHTVVGVVEDALEIFKPANDIHVVTSSRTDAGVHALCNTVHCDLVHPDGPDLEYDADILCRGLNSFFHHAEEPIRALRVLRVADDFHARFKALSRTYVYRITVAENTPLHHSWVYPITPFDIMTSHLIFPPFDHSKAKAAMEILSGRNNFYAFTSKKMVQPWQSRVKNLQTHFQTGSNFMDEYSQFSRVHTHHENYDLVFKGSSFLFRQVRKMVSAVINVARGFFSLDDLKDSLKRPHMYQGHNMITSCPAQALFLIDVEYKSQDIVHQCKRSDQLLTLPQWEYNPEAFYRKFDDKPYEPDTTPEMEEKEKQELDKIS